MGPFIVLILESLTCSSSSSQCFTLTVISTNTMRHLVLLYMVAAVMTDAGAVSPQRFLYLDFSLPTIIAGILMATSSLAIAVGFAIRKDPVAETYRFVLFLAWIVPFFCALPFCWLSA